MSPFPNIFKVNQPRVMSHYAVIAWPGIMLGSATTLLLLSACTSPTAALQAAETSITNADQARVASYSISQPINI